MCVCVCVCVCVFITETFKHSLTPAHKPLSVSHYVESAGRREPVRYINQPALVTIKMKLSDEESAFEANLGSARA